jgi:ribonuclease HIII
MLETINNTNTAALPTTGLGGSYSDSQIGSDECLKGDTFGGIIVAGVALDAQGRKNAARALE